jgi:hypothetical protein
LWDEKDEARHRRRLQPQPNRKPTGGSFSPASVASASLTAHATTRPSALAPPLHLDPNDVGLRFLSLSHPRPAGPRAADAAAAAEGWRALQAALVDDPLRPLAPRALRPVSPAHPLVRAARKRQGEDRHTATAA